MSPAGVRCAGPGGDRWYAWRVPSLAVPIVRRDGRRRAGRILAPPLLGLVAAAVAAVHVVVPAIWRDEAASITMAQRDWGAFDGTIAHVDAVHALYYGGLHLWFDVVPYSPLTLRLPSVLAVGGTAALVTILGTRIAGFRSGVAAGAAAAVLPSLVWAGGEGRSYAITAFLATATTLALLAALEPAATRGRTTVRWAGYAALLALTIACFADAALLGAAHAVTILLIGRGRRIAGLAAVAAAGLAASPLLVLVAGQREQVAWIAQYGPPPLWTAGVQQQWFRSEPVMQAWAGVLAVGLLAAVIRRRLPSRVPAVVLPWAVLPPVALVGIGLVQDPVYWPRYVTFTAPAVALLLGALVALLPAPLTAVALLLLAAVAVPQVRVDREPRAKASSELQLAARLVAAERRAADGPSGIVFGQYNDIAGMTTRIEAIAYPHSFRGLEDLRAREPLRRSTALFGDDIATDAAVARMTHLKTVWILLDVDARPATPVPAAEMEAIGLHETGRFRTPGSLLLRWSR